MKNMASVFKKAVALTLIMMMVLSGYASANMYTIMQSGTEYDSRLIVPTDGIYGHPNVLTSHPASVYPYQISTAPSTADDGMYVFGNYDKKKSIDDQDANIVYSGSWNNWSDSGNYKSTERFSGTAADYAEYTFQGQFITWIGPKGPNNGKADVYIDDELVQASIDLYAPSKQYQQELFTKKGLSNKLHKIKIVVTGTKHPSASDTQVAIDKFECSPHIADDRDSLLTYSGTWSNVADPNAFNGTEKHSTTPGSYVEYSFFGPFVKWVGAKGPDYGMADVYVDGVLVQAGIDLYAAEKQYQQELYNNLDLTPGVDHTIKIVVTGTKNGASSGYNVVVDSIEVVPYGDVIQRMADGSLRGWLGAYYYVTPTQHFNQYTLDEHILPTINSGINQVLIEEPELFSDSLYNAAYKAEWQAYYGSAWEDPQSSESTFMKAVILSNYLLQRRIDDVYGYVKLHYPSVTTIIGAHTGMTEFVWKNPFAVYEGFANSNVDVYEGQTWSNTIELPAYYQGVSQSMPFETAYIDYSYWANAKKAAGKELISIMDPKGDFYTNKPWDWVTQMYRHQVVSTVMFPNIYKYNTVIWPARILGNDDWNEAPDSFKTVMSNIITELGKMHHYTTQITTSNRPVKVGFMISDTMNNQVGGPGSTVTPASIHSLIMPLLKEGLLVDSLPLEGITSTNDILSDYDVIMLSYDLMKPLDSAYNVKLKDYINAGGIVLYVGGRTEFDTISEMWWKTAGYASPQDHLMDILGAGLSGRNDAVTSSSLSPQTGSALATGIGTLSSTSGYNMIGYASGSGVTPMYKSGANIVAFQKEYGSGKFIYFGVDPYYFGASSTGSAKMVQIMKNIASQFKSVSVSAQSAIDYMRGPYRGIHSLNGTQTVTGKYIDLFDPNIPLVTTKKVLPGESALLYDVSGITVTTTPKVLFAQGQSPVISEASNATNVIVGKGSSNTLGTIRILSKPGIVPALATAVDHNGRSMLYSQEWDDVTQSLLIKYWNDPEGVTVNVSWSNSGTPPFHYTKTADDRDLAVTCSGTNYYNDALLGNYLATEKYVKDSGAYCQFPFKGTSIRWMGISSNHGGTADVYIDGSLDTANVDTYDSNTGYKRVLYTKTGLSNTDHVIKVSANGMKNVNALDTNVQIDKFEYGSNRLISVDDQDTAISYSGSWNNWTDAANYNSTEKFSSTAGDAIEFGFTGPVIRVIGHTGPFYGKVNVYVDGVLRVAGLDLYSPTRNYQQVLFSDATLTKGNHTIRIELSGTKNVNSSAYNVVLDKFEVGTSSLNRVDDRDSEITYSGSWSNSADNQSYNGTERLSSTTGDYFEYIFNGPVVKWFGPKGPQYGKANVYIDGILAASGIDLYAPSKVYNQELFATVTGTGPHTLKVEVAGAKNASSIGFTIVTDKVESSGGAATNVDDRDSAIHYTGAWSQYNSTNNYNGTETYSSSAGASASFTFKGNSIRIVGPKTPFYGIANVYIDNVLQGQFDQYSSSVSYQQALFERKLSYGTHTVKVEVSGNKNANSTGNTIVLDKLEYETTQAADDRDSAIFMRGAWADVTDAAAYHSTERMNGNGGDYMLFSFTGSTIKWIGSKGPNYGKADVYVDNKLEASDIDLYSASKLNKQILFAKSDLSSDAHTIKIVVKVTKNASSSHYNVAVDRFEY
ncbi:hypothetical protein [Paenibacillus eucommiae]|uniref:Uncharacterized protein n=1 Tax=Paenibacillus eucommiae TaxID=1355755 RepID=A0ABS4J674_9BACL|nr:hypothetical protein [Paenibacillus eucommiae]MBP1995330.1 hypothetical protein [Paenibacillus eucommiae]